MDLFRLLAFLDTSGLDAVGPLAATEAGPQMSLTHILGLIVVIAPLLMLAGLGIPSLLGRSLSERATTRLVQSSIGTGFLAAVGVWVLMLAQGIYRVPIPLGNWVQIPHYHFSVKFEFDRLSVPFVLLSFSLCGTIGAFASKYMHREPGFNRFYVLYAMFVLGMAVTSLAGTIETLFAGWELVGLSSALLVAFYQERVGPVRNGLHVWVVYRISDAALLVAAVVLHHLTGEGDFDVLMGKESWPHGVVNAATLLPNRALVVGLLLLLAAAGKSALVPFSGWLPRAMEGPTPSSAVFYGALSVHLGAYLLLRVSPILDLSPVLRGTVVATGLITAIFATFTGRAQTDVKSALSFASLTQVGIIVTEIGLAHDIGWWMQYVALVHIIGHACLRTLQFVRAPSLLLDYQTLENAIGSHLPRSGNGKMVPNRAGLWLYRLAMERGYLDALLIDYIVEPILSVLRWCDSLERKWTDFLSGGKSRQSDRIKSSPGLDELL